MQHRFCSSGNFRITRPASVGSVLQQIRRAHRARKPRIRVKFTASAADDAADDQPSEPLLLVLGKAAMFDSPKHLLFDVPRPEKSRVFLAEFDRGADSVTIVVREPFQPRREPPRECKPIVFTPEFAAGIQMFAPGRGVHAMR